MMEQRFLEHVKQAGYFEQHRRVLIALSGGLDSMTLLQLLVTHAQELEIELVLAHVHHGQRLESDEEEKLLAQYAQQLGLPFFSRRFYGEFSEAAGRTFRYDFFKEVMSQQKCTALVTAHHANDQAETIFMRLLRGSRLRFFTGIQDRQPFGSGELIRPLLPFKKSDFPDSWHFEDLSNHENHYLRNRIRNVYIPTLEQENPQLQPYLIQLGQEVGQLQQALRDLTRGLDGTDLSQFSRQTPAVQSFLLEEYLTQFSDLEISHAQFEQILHILRTKANYRAALKGDYELIKDYTTFSIQKISPESDSQKRSDLLEYGNILEKEGYRFSFGQPLEGEVLMELFVSRETPITLRYRQPGDFFRLHGQTKKVRRYFIDHKICQKDREHALILEQAGQIIGIAGIVASDLSQAAKSDIIQSKLYIQKLDR